MAYAVAPLSLPAMLLVATVTSQWACVVVYVATEDCYDVCRSRWAQFPDAQPALASLLVLAVVVTGLPLVRERWASVAAACGVPLVAWLAFLALGEASH